MLQRSVLLRPDSRRPAVRTSGANPPGLEQPVPCPRRDRRFPRQGLWGLAEVQPVRVVTATALMRPSSRRLHPHERAQRAGPASTQGVISVPHAHGARTAARSPETRHEGMGRPQRGCSWSCAPHLITDARAGRSRRETHPFYFVI